MNIRLAETKDVPGISVLLEQLGYPKAKNFLTEKVQQLLADTNHELLVYEEDQIVLGFISVHFEPQLAVSGDFAIVSYLCVDDAARSKGIGKKLLDRVTMIAKDRNCDRIQLHSNIRRLDAHRFYEREGFHESRKFFRKKL